MGQNKSKAIRPANGNVEYDAAIDVKMNEKVHVEPRLVEEKPQEAQVAEMKQKIIAANKNALFKGTETLATVLTQLKAQAVPQLEKKKSDNDNNNNNNNNNNEKKNDKKTPEKEEKSDDKPAEKEVEKAKACSNEDQQDEKSASSPAASMDQYAVDYEHVKQAVVKFIDSVETTDKHEANQLVELFGKHVNGKSEEYKHWSLGRPINAKNRLKSVTNYAETNAKCTPDVKTKLRVITKLILEDIDNVKDYEGIFCLLASHGNVCNVMKEVAINDSFHIMTGGMKEHVESQTLQQQVIQVLQKLRVLLIETLFHSLKFSNNTHYVAGFHNTFAEAVGVVPYNDPDICYPSSSKHPNWRKDLDKRFFKEMYTVERILAFLYVQIDSKKIGYQKIVAWFEENCPAQVKKTDWLATVIDIDTGKIREQYMCYMLQKMGILLVKDDQWKPIPKTWT